MSSTESEESTPPQNREELYHDDLSSSSTVPPMEAWSSLIQIEVPESPKRVLYKQGLYDPGSGEVCAKYLPMSDSDVLRHVYYAYPRVRDPGIIEALYQPEKIKVYKNDGQDLYLDLCEEMNLIPVRSFHRGLLQKVIDLKYYGVNPIGVRAMCLALSNNLLVRRVDLTSNYLTDDACYHLGRLLAVNTTITELILTQCKLRPEGLKRVVIHLYARPMELLDVSRNELGNEGFEHLAEQLVNGAVIKRLSLSYNELSLESALAFAAALKLNKSITHLDLSWNKLYQPKGIDAMLRQLSDSKILTELHLSWNALTVGAALKRVLAMSSLRILDLSHNRLESTAAKTIFASLHLAKKLNILDLSFNPFTPADALLILSTMRNEEVLLENLLMDEIVVNKEFAESLKQILQLNCRSTTKFTHGRVCGNYSLSLPDLRIIIMKRLFFLTNSNKKCSLDMPLFFLQEFKERLEPKLMNPRELTQVLKTSGAVVDDGLLDEFVRAFPGPKVEGGITIMLQKVVEFIKRLWPDKQLPQKPPPSLLQSVPQPQSKKKNGKQKKKKK